MKNSMVLAMAAAMLAAMPASAATIFDTGTPTGPSGYNVYHNGSADFQSLAAQFTLTQATRITGIEAFFGGSAPGQDKVVLALHGDVDGVPGQAFGPAIASAIVTIPSSVQGIGNWFGGFQDGAVTLTAGTYWTSISVDPNDPARCICWLPASNTVTIPFGAYANGFTGGNWRERDLNFGLRIFGDPAAGAVPEPMTWALMIVGFGAVGSAMRRAAVRTSGLGTALA